MSEKVDTKAYEEKINAQLQQAKAQLGDFEARAKGKMARAEIDTVNRLKTKHQEIDKKRQNLKTSDQAKVGQAKAEIGTELGKLKTSMAELATKPKAELRTKAS